MTLGVVSPDTDYINDDQHYQIHTAYCYLPINKCISTVVHMNSKLLIFFLLIGKMVFCYILKCKLTNIPNSEENSKRKVRNHMAKSKTQTHQTNV